MLIRSIPYVVAGIIASLFLAASIPDARAGRLLYGMDGNTYYVAPEKGENCVLGLGRSAPIDAGVGILLDQLMSGNMTVTQYIAGIEALIKKEIPEDAKQRIRAGFRTSCGIVDGKPA